jgi:homopolymeric O-antigen transport system permease protein
MAIVTSEASSLGLNEVVYTPRSELLHPGRLFLSMFRDLAACRELAWRLFVRDLSARYRQSLLGYVWAFLPPLATTIPFVFLRSQGLFTTGATAIPYPAYVMISMLFWQVFVDAVQSPLKAVTAAKPMISKIQFPPEAILMAGLGDVLFSFLIRLVLLAAVLIWYGIIPPVTALLVPVVVIALVTFGFMVGLLVTPLGILYTDVTQSLTIITSFWLFLTPVVYPARETGLAGVVSRWNPVSPMVIVGRDWLTLGTTAFLPEFLVVLALSLVMLFSGWIIYRIALPHLIARIGN